jgi:hypothetical protein
MLPAGWMSGSFFGGGWPLLPGMMPVFSPHGLVTPGTNYSLPAVFPAQAFGCQQQQTQQGDLLLFF